MIDPISSQKVECTLSKSSLFRPLERDYASSLCSMKCANPFTWIWNFLKWLICCGTSSVKTDSTFEVHPSTLSSRDPFRKEVFSPDCTLRSKEAFDVASKLFHTLGTTGFLHWVSHFISLTKQEKILKNFSLHPLEFLYFVFCNKTKSSEMLHFRNESETWKARLRLLTGRSPWDEFVNKQARNFAKKQSGEIFKMIPGFCQALNLDKRELTPLASQRNWAEFINAVFVQRKKHFNL